MVVIIFLFSILALIIIAVIDYYFTGIRPYKQAVANLKVGDKYTYIIEGDDPFIETEILECTIMEIRYGKDNEPYVKYEFTDGSGSTMRFDRFFSQFNKVN
jgi:hypothetical protein